MYYSNKYFSEVLRIMVSSYKTNISKITRLILHISINIYQESKIFREQYDYLGDVL